VEGYAAREEYADSAVFDGEGWGWYQDESGGGEDGRGGAGGQVWVGPGIGQQRRVHQAPQVIVPSKKAVFGKKGNDFTF
jgi:hypothetical protein